MIVSELDIRKIVYATFAEEKKPLPKKIGIILVDNNKIKQLNRKYRKVDAITDILTFKYNTHEGEIFISIDSIKQQARLYKQSFKKEFVFVLIHGLLHFLGWDDTDDYERKEMWSKQKAIMDKVL